MIPDVYVGEFRNVYDASKAYVTAGQKEYAERVRLIIRSRNDNYAAIGVPPGPPTAKGIYGEAEYRGSYGAYALEPLGDHDAPDNWPRKPYKRPYGGTPGPPVMYGKASNPEDEGAGYGYRNAMRQQESDVFYYHSDHLGSTTYVTGKDGEATQFVSYKPYGEALVDEHNTAREQPWRFNGKELDAETGLYYYGARYYDPSLAMWYGVDALAGDYPGLGGYVYCAGNPVRLVDVDGRKIKISPTASSKQKSAYDDVVSFAKGSALFSTLYSKLEESHIVYTILFGNTVESTNGVVQAQYSAKDNSITINKNLSSISEAALTEELFHALQNESNDGSNREFEAKVFVFASGYVKTKSAAGMREFYNYLENNMYEDAEGRPLSVEVVNSKEFVQRYKLAQKSFAEYNQRNDIGNIHYKKHSDSSPALLIKIINEAYSERN